MNKPKAFLILSPGFAASETDTACLPMQQSFVKTLAAIYPDIEVVVFSLQYPFHRCSYTLFGATVKSFGGRNRAGIPKFVLRRRVDKELRRLHFEKEIIGILSFWLGECAYIGKNFARKNGLTHYCWLMGQDARSNNKYAKVFSTNNSSLIALSDFLEQEFEKNYGIRPFTVIAPGMKCRSNGSVRDIDLLAVGSLIPLKQFEIFIESVAAIKQEIPNIKAMLVGDGPQRKVLMHLINSLGVRDNIKLAGKTDHDEILSLMQRTKILLHPSSYEGYSGVCQEALSCGAHVISFCRAMNSNIDQWHIVNSKNEMTGKAITLLRNASTPYQPTSFPSMITTAKQMMKLYLSEAQ